PLQSSFTVSHAMLLNVIGRPGDAFAAMRHLLTDNHEDPAAQRRHIRRAFAIYRALLAGGVVERLAEPDEQGRRWRLTVDLQGGFALHQALSAVAQMKADGIEYEERMELLENVTYPMPLADLLEAAYDMYRRGHPWVADHELSPKSVVRDMYERSMNFLEYVGYYR